MPGPGDGPLVGRVRELRELHEAFEDARHGRGGVQLVLGEPGIGKTRLADALAEHAAERGARLVRTRGWGPAAPAYWPWVEVVRDLARELDGETLRRELGPAADELVRLAPELGERPPPAQLPVREDEDPKQARFALFDALVALLRARSASAPVVIVMDDLQAADEGSLVALDFVSQMLRDAAVLLVVTMHERVPERAPDAQRALQNIVRSSRRLVLGGLDRDAVGRLVELTSGARPAPALVDAVHAVTEGNPLFARELLALLLAEGRLHDPPHELPLPDGVRATIRRRLEPLGAERLATLELAAVIGRAFGLTWLEAASPIDRERVLDALEQAVALGLVVPVVATIGQYRFGHGLIREVLLDGMPPAARRHAHRAVGEAVERVCPGAIETHLPTLADHFLAALPRGDVAKAVDYAERAAQRALGALAYEQAAELFDRALQALDHAGGDLPRRARLLLGLGTAQSRAGRPAARATFEAAVAAARAIGADEMVARAALGFAPFALAPGYVDDAHVAVLAEALERIGDGDSPTRVRLLSSLAVALYWSDARERRSQLAGEALAIARRLGDEATLAIALSSAQLATSGPDMTEQGARWLEELFALTERAGESVLSLAARSRHVDVLLELDDLAGADTAVETLERLAREAREPRAAAFVPLHRARRAALEGRVADAERMLAAVAATAGELSASTIPLSVASQGVILTLLAHGPRAIVERVRVPAAASPAMPCWRAAFAAALADAGRREAAVLELDRLVADDFAALPHDNLWLAAMALLCEAIVALDLPERAHAVHAKLVPFQGRNVVLPTVAYLGPVELWLGIMARIAGREGEALGWLAAARTRAKRDGARPALTRIAVEEAAVHLRDGRATARQRAEELLEDAAAACEEMGLSWLGLRVLGLRDELRERAPTAAAGPAPTDAETAALRRIGDVWALTCRGHTVHLNDARGVRLLALLLERPGSELHSLDLAAAIDGEAANAQLVERSDGRGVGAGRNGAQAERARINVTRALRTTLARIAGYAPQLGEELALSVRTGTFCVYAPDPRSPLRWTVER